MSFAKLLRKARIAAGLSQGEMAARFGVAQGTYSAYESLTKPQIPSIEKAAKMAVICDVSLDYLAGLTSDPTPKWKIAADEVDLTANKQSPTPESVHREMSLEERVSLLEDKMARLERA